MRVFISPTCPASVILLFCSAIPLNSISVLQGGNFLFIHFFINSHFFLNNNATNVRDDFFTVAVRKIFFAIYICITVADFPPLFYSRNKTGLEIQGDTALSADFIAGRVRKSSVRIVLAI